MNEATAERNAKCRVLIAGVGNGGGRAVAEMARQWQDGPEMVALDTDAGELASLNGVRQVRIGAKIMKGMGTGGDPRVGRRAVEADAAAVRELFKDINLAFLVVGLGGGTGTGAAPFIAEEARKAGALTLCFAMLPFEFEGQRRKEHAQHGLLALADTADGVICLPNQRIFELVEDHSNVAEAFQKTDALLGRGVQAVWRVLCRKGAINLDFADVRALLQEGAGKCVFACAEGAGPGKVDLVLQALRADPLLLRGQALARAQAYIVSIIGGADFTLKDVDRLMRGIAEFSRKEALAMTGVSCDPALADRVFVTILAAEQAAEDAAPLPRQAVARPAAPAAALPAAEEDLLESATKKKPPVQGNLFDKAGQGRFKDVDPTIVEGNNLDIPTFIRRRIMIQKPHDSAL